MLSQSVPLREMLSLLLSRRRVYHRAFGHLDDLLAQIDGLVRSGADVRFVVMVGPRIGDLDTTREALSRIDEALARLKGPVDLVVFDDVMHGEASQWARVQPRLRSAMPPRLFEVLRLIDEPS